MVELEIDWQNATDTAIDQNAIRAHLELILRRLGRVGMVSIEINMVGDQKITQLNQQFRQVQTPTDVLSFPAASTELPEPLLGSIVVSLETASRQAAAAGVSLIDEVKTLCGHGLLHLLGFHHR